MKRAGYLLFLLIVLLVPRGVYAISAQSAYSSLGSDLDKMNTYIDTVNSQSSTADEVAASARTTKTALRNSASAYLDIDDANEKTITYFKNISSALSIMATSMDTIETSLNTQDEALYSSSIDEYNRGLGIFNTNLEAINETQGVNSQFDPESLYIIATVVAGLISLVTLLQSLFGNRMFTAERLRNSYQKQIFLASLWPLIGSAVTLIWYELTPPGGTYTILWGPVLFGYFAFFRQLYEYFKNQRPGVNQLKKHEEQNANLPF
jgi:hypothetical protein